MNRELDVAIHKLESGFSQVSFIHPIELRRVRRRFRVAGEAERYRKLVQQQFTASGLNVASAVTISVVLKSYLESNQKTQMRRLGLPVFLSFVETFGDRPVMAVTKDSLIEWMSRTKTERGFADRTMEHLKTYVSPFFEFLVDTGVIRQNPFVEIVIPRGVSRKKHEKFTEDEVRELLRRVKAVSPEIIFPVAYFLAQTGCRLGEARELKWSSINFENETIHFRRTKNGDDRHIQMSPQLLQFLRSHQQVSEYVFLTIEGKPWRVPQYRKQFQNVRAAIKFPKHWTNHGLRHSFAFNYLRQGGDMRQLQYILGHRKLQMTVDLYGKFTPTDTGTGSPFTF